MRAVMLDETINTNYQENDKLKTYPDKPPE